jgi:hypothetical protein
LVLDLSQFSLLPQLPKKITHNGTMSADIFKRKMAHAIQLKWTFLALKWAVFCLKIVSKFYKKATPANSKQNLNKMLL